MVMTVAPCLLKRHGHIIELDDFALTKNCRFFMKKTPDRGLGYTSAPPSLPVGPAPPLHVSALLFPGPAPSEVIIVTDVQIDVEGFPVTVPIGCEDVLMERSIDADRDD